VLRVDEKTVLVLGKSAATCAAVPVSRVSPHYLFLFPRRSKILQMSKPNSRCAISICSGFEDTTITKIKMHAHSNSRCTCQADLAAGRLWGLNWRVMLPLPLAHRHRHRHRHRYRHNSNFRLEMRMARVFCTCLLIWHARFREQ
jgi:hypothetical protein